MTGLRDQNLVRQQLDFSCGAAALATILRYSFGEDIDERQVLVELFDLLPPEEQAVRRRTGFSLLDLQRVAAARGFAAEGFRLGAEQIRLVSGPVLVFIQPRGYAHFAVFRGVRGDRVFLADPSRGNIRMPLYAFLDEWLGDDGTGIIFAVRPAVGSGADLFVTPGGELRPPPEILSARELLAVGNPLLRFSPPR
jgi:predicted double-glycine peptidase